MNCQGIPLTCKDSPSLCPTQSITRIPIEKRMSHQSNLIKSDIDAYLKQHEQKELLRLLTCGSVDDGKSTLIGRLFYDAKLMFEDQLAAIEKDSINQGTTGGSFDPALFTDGLTEEREQGITIDVAYRYFSTNKRKFIIADTPGHEQYTRNMATGASTADLAVILIDARHGVLTQTKRHSFIVTLLGIKHVLVAINKMDLVDFSEERFEEIQADYRDFAARLDIPDLHFLPISALKGDNIVDAGNNMPWFQGSTLMNFLENIYIGSDRNMEDFRFPVQLVNRPHLDFRGFCGTIASGIIRKGDEIMALPSKKKSRIQSIVTQDGELDEAFTPQSVTLTLEDEIDISRGDMIVRPGNVPKTDQHFDAAIVWMDEEPLVPGKEYYFKHSTHVVSGIVNRLRYQIDVNTLHRQEAAKLELNGIGRCHVSTTAPLFFDGYRRNRATGSFIVVDRISNVTVAAGMILQRNTSDNRTDYWDDLEVESNSTEDIESVTPQERAQRLAQTPATLLLTGKPGSGKTSLARTLERKLFAAGYSSLVLDGPVLRRGISKDLDYSMEGRSENLRRATEIAKIVNQSGLIAILSIVAPSSTVRGKAASSFTEHPFLVVHLDPPDAEIARRNADRDVMTVAYESPDQPDLKLDTQRQTVSECADQIIELMTNQTILR